MRVALAQINPTVGDIPGNLSLHRTAIEQARDAGASLVVFPELSVVGYPPKDLLLKPAFIRDAGEALQQIATLCTGDGFAALVGYPCPSDDLTRGLPFYNAMALCRGGRIVQRHIKHLLPTYDVFDERRYFEPGDAVALSEHAGTRWGVSVCEDLWNDIELFPRRLYDRDPIADLAAAGAQVILNASASPFVYEKHDFRLKLLASAARRHARPVLYCNQVGGNDELVFDGNSCAVSATGELIAHARDFEPDLLLVDLNGTNRIDTPATGLASVYRALVLGLRDYCAKCGFTSVVIGLSGGIDSALTAVLAVAALGRERVTGVAMPSRYSSDHALEDARRLALNLGIALHHVPIDAAHQAAEATLAPLFAGRPPDVTEENMQARLRGLILMAVSNKFGSMVVTTGNKSELAVGYCTLYGDMCGGLAVLSDVPKTMVYDLSRWINTPGGEAFAHFRGPMIPQGSIDKPPSAELRPNQTDQDSLPPYDQLDEVIERYVEREQAAAQIIHDTGFDPAMVQRVVRLIDRNEYKRKQAAPGLKVTGRAFGTGRRMPIAQRYESR